MQNRCEKGFAELAVQDTTTRIREAGLRLQEQSTEQKEGATALETKDEELQAVEKLKKDVNSFLIYAINLGLTMPKEWVILFFLILRCHMRNSEE